MNSVILKALVYESCRRRFAVGGDVTWSEDELNRVQSFAYL